MIALLLALIFFAYFAIVGRATFALLDLRFGHVRTWLLAPTLGLAVIGLIVMVPNQSGVPMAAYVRPLILVIIIGALGVLVWRNLVPPKGLAPFALLATGALLLGGWPALVHGLNWVSYGNDDMTNYCLGAQRLISHGFYDIPTPTDLAGADYSQLSWLLNVATMERFTSQLLIASASVTVGLTTVQVFMPAIIACALTQLWAFTALVYSSPRRRTQALIAGTILATAPLWHYGTTYQLIAQVGGLALLAACLVITTRTRFPRSLAGRLKFSFLCALLVSSLSITYPELIPFLVIGWGLYLSLKIYSRRHWITGLLPTLALMILFVLLLLRHNVLGAVFSLLGQTQRGLSAIEAANTIALFPYFLIPAGPSFFFGLNVIVWRYTDPYALPALLAGFAAIFLTLGLWIRGLRAHDISATVLAVMFLVGAVLFASSNGFGLFKLAMFALPFVAIELARLSELRFPRLALRGLFGVMLVIWITGSVRYTGASLADDTKPVNELFGASASRGNLPIKSTPVWSDMTSSPIAKLLMLENSSPHSTFLSQIFGDQFFGIAYKAYPNWVYQMLPGDIHDTTAAQLVEYIQGQVYHREHALELNFWSRAMSEETPRDPAIALVTSQAELRSFNKLTSRWFTGSGLFTYTALSSLENHLVFIKSEQGQHYYLGDAGMISVYKPEIDPYSTNGYFFVIGRHVLFRVLNPTKTVRLRFNMTSTLLGDGRTALPEHATIKGGATGPVTLGLVGAGSANVFSSPMQPQLINGVPYIALDLGQPVIPIGRQASGLEGLFNRNLTYDTRLGIGYCRDISMVSEAEYEARPHLRKVRHFPADLVGPAAVEYSGIYEDGWVSDHAFAVLGPVYPGDKITVQALLPLISGKAPISTNVELLANGVTLLRKEVSPGHFTLESRLPQVGRQVKIELRFDRTETLPAPDNRPVTVLLEELTITPNK